MFGAIAIEQLLASLFASDLWCDEKLFLLCELLMAILVYAYSFHDNALAPDSSIVKMLFEICSAK